MVDEPRAQRAARRRTITFAVVAGVLALAWTELALNLAFHWLTTADDLVLGLGVPERVTLVFPLAFVSWGLYLMAGADRPALGKTAVAVTAGSGAAAGAIALGAALAGVPDFWGVAVATGAAIAVLALLRAVGDDVYAAAALPAFAAVMAWWLAAGLDGYIDGGGGSGDRAAAIAVLVGSERGPVEGGDAAGLGGLSGLLSSPWPWVCLSVWLTLLCGLVLGVLNTRVAGILGGRDRPVQPRRPRLAEPEPEPQPEPDSDPGAEARDTGPLRPERP